MLFNRSLLLALYPQIERIQESRSDGTLLAVDPFRRRLAEPETLYKAGVDARHREYDWSTEAPPMWPESSLVSMVAEEDEEAVFSGRPGSCQLEICLRSSAMLTKGEDTQYDRDAADLAAAIGTCFTSDTKTWS